MLSICELVGCGGLPKAAGKTGDTLGPTSAVEKTDSGECLAIAIPSAPSQAGQIVFSVSPDIDPCTVNGYIVGSQNLTIQHATGNQFFISNVPAGNHDVIITALASTLKQDVNKGEFGIRLSNLIFSNGTSTQIKDAIEIPIAGSLSGIAHLSGDTNFSGVTISIPGTSYVATTDASGNFGMNNVPVGVEEVHLEHSGYATGKDMIINIASADNLDLGTLTLLIDAAEEIASSFNPTQCWQSITANNAPGPGFYADKYNLWGIGAGGDPAAGVAIDKGVFFYGQGDDDGLSTAASLYDPVLNTWTKLTNGPLELQGATAVWTGQDVLVWGGSHFAGQDTTLNQQILRYTPATDSWQTITTNNALSGRTRAGGIWTGTKMIVWGGETDQPSYASLNDGGSYDPSTNTWSPIETPSELEGRSWPTVIWSGSKMIVAGGTSNNGNTLSVTSGSYDPTSNTWSIMPASPVNIVTPGVWTGSKLVAPYFGSGGEEAPVEFVSYDPLANQWTQLPQSNIPFFNGGRMDAAWFGGKMLLISSRFAMMIDPFTCN